MGQSDEPPFNRRRFFGLGLKGLSYTAPAVLTLAMPPLPPDEAEGAETQMGGMAMMMRMRMMMSMSMSMSMMPMR